jgi:hypothetical protein
VARVLVMGSVFLPGMVMDPLVAVLRERGMTAEWVAPMQSATAGAVAQAYVAAARRVGATTAIAHSNAGNFIPAVAAGSAVQRVVFMDATVPPLTGGTWPVVPSQMRESLLSRATQGVLPPWTQWWPDEEVAALFPNQETYVRVDASTPTVDTSYLSSRISAPRGWSAALDCSYVAFGETYADDTAEAARAGWPVRRLELGHLGMLQDPAMVADAVLTS